MSETDRNLLTLAATPYRYAALRDERALAEFGLSPTRFWARVNMLLDDPTA
ncbi:MAG TPA: DUF3263 domain-containing protein [Nocardioides sp.]|uniref:DUF3263 domain-containing protein n=1 Tax=Nocardioides sp. TaxID=35761 RepID=UPI002ED85561